MLSWGIFHQHGQDDVTCLKRLLANIKANKRIVKIRPSGACSKHTTRSCNVPRLCFHKIPFNRSYQDASLSRRFWISLCLVYGRKLTSDQTVRCEVSRILSLCHCSCLPVAEYLFSCPAPERCERHIRRNKCEVRRKQKPFHREEEIRDSKLALDECSLWYHLCFPQTKSAAECCVVISELRTPFYTKMDAHVLVTI